MSRPITKGVFEFVDHQAVAVDAEPFQCDWPSGDVTPNTLELLTLIHIAGHSRIQGKAIALSSQCFNPFAVTSHGAGAAQGHRLAASLRAYGWTFSNQFNPAFLTASAQRRKHVGLPAGLAQPL